jgi:hypothetical protein
VTVGGVGYGDDPRVSEVRIDGNGVFMGWYVHLHVAFNCNTNDDVASVAEKYARQLEGTSAPREALWFLKDLAVRAGDNPGPKGGLSLWGVVGNHTNAHAFVHCLSDFWLELLSGSVDGGPCDHHHVIVFYEEEQSRQAHCYEVALTERCQDRLGDYYECLGEIADGKWRMKPEESRPPKPPPELEIKHHALPFAWMQY